MSASKRANASRATQYAAGTVATPAANAGSRIAGLVGRDHVLPDDVQALATAVLAHRILVAPGHADEARAAVIDDALDRLPAL